MSDKLIKSIKDLSKAEQRAIVLKALNDAGYNDHQSSLLMDISRQRVSQVQKGIKKGTLNPLVKKAKKAVAAILVGQTVGQVRDIRASDVLTAAKMVLDRSDPVVQKVEQSHLHLNVEIKDEDRERYRKALGVGVIEGEFEPVPEQKCLPDSSSQSDSSCLPSVSESQAELNQEMSLTSLPETRDPEPVIPKYIISHLSSLTPQKDGQSSELRETQLGESGRLASG